MYKSEIVDTSLENMSKVELVAYKDVSDCILLEKYLEQNDDEITMVVKDYVELAVQNDRADNTNYNVFIIIDEGGTKYRTGSDSFKRAFLDIYNDLKDETGWAIKIYSKPSRNYNGKNFLTCSVVIL